MSREPGDGREPSPGFLVTRQNKVAAAILCFHGPARADVGATGNRTDKPVEPDAIPACPAAALELEGGRHFRDGLKAGREASGARQ